MFSRGDKLEKGHYTVIKEIGVGGMGVVYHCKDEQLLRDVAIKMLLPELMADRSNLDVFHQEARLAAQLEHPNVVTVYDVGVEERNSKQHHYVCMEYLPGGNLANRVISGPLAVEHCLNWMKQLASGLTYAHKRGVVHQDIKADNIFITNEGDLKIGDFGLARLLVGRVHYNAQTKGMGTPAYMSPELCRGEPQDHRSDIYSLGVLFFEMATGQLPFRARGMIEMATKHSSAPIPSAKRLNPLVPEILDKVIRRMMSKTPEERYPSMSEVLTILDDLIFELRVARLGLGNRPLMRSGNIQAELLAHAQGQAQQQIQQPMQATKPVELPQSDETSWTRTRSSMRPDTEPHTTSLPPVDHTVAAQLKEMAGKDKQMQSMSASEQLIAQLENLEASGVPVVEAPPRNTPRSLAAGHFVNTQQIGGTAGSAPVLPTGAAATTPTAVPFDVVQARTGSTATPGSGAAAPSSNATSSHGANSAGASASPNSGAMSRSGSGPGSAFAPSAGSSSAAAPATGSSQANSTSGTTGSRISQSPHLVPGSGLETTDGTIVDPLQQFKSPPRTFQSPRTSSSVLPKMRHGPLLQNLKNGLQLQWTLQTKGPIGWGSSPVTDKEERYVFVSSADGHVYSVDSKSGDVIWKTSIGAPILTSPVLSGDKILTASSNGLLCGISSKDGKILWRYDVRETLVATPCVVKDSLIVPGSSGKLLALECDSGLQKWQFKSDSGIVAAPHQHGNLVLFGNKSGEFFAVGSETGKKIWKFNAGSPIAASPAASVDSVYFGTQGGTFFSLDVESGRLCWEYSTDRPIISRAAIAFTSVLFCGHDKWLYCCERYDGGLKWKGALKGRVVANLMVSRETAITVTREGWIQAFATTSGDILWQRDVGRSLESAPLITSDRLYIGSVEGELICYTFNSASVLSEKSA